MIPVSDHGRFASAVADRIRQALESEDRKAALHEPSISKLEKEAVEQCLDSTFVSSVGRYVNAFEEALSEFTGATCVAAVVNGTAALHVSLLMAGVQCGDEVLLPAMTFVATANSVAYANAIPHFVEVEERTLGIDAESLRKYLDAISDRRGGRCVNRFTGRQIRAVVPMHTFGHPADMDAIMAVSVDYGLVVVEDAAEALGSYYKGKHVGRHGLLATLSFNGNKIVTTGGGGAILTDDPELGQEIRHLTTTAKVPHPYRFIHDRIGYNYRLPNINAALGCAQMARLPEFLERKRQLTSRYVDAFADFDGARIFQPPGFAYSNNWLNALVLEDPDEALMTAIIENCSQAGIMTRPVWELMHHLPMYKDCPRMETPVAESLSKRIINIPSGVQW